MDAIYTKMESIFPITKTENNANRQSAMDFIKEQSNKCKEKNGFDFQDLLDYEMLKLESKENGKKN